VHTGSRCRLSVIRRQLFRCIRNALCKCTAHSQATNCFVAVANHLRRCRILDTQPGCNVRWEQTHHCLNEKRQLNNISGQWRRGLTTVHSLRQFKSIVFYLTKCLLLFIACAQLQLVCANSVHIFRRHTQNSYQYCYGRLALSKATFSLRRYRGSTKAANSYWYSVRRLYEYI